MILKEYPRDFIEIILPKPTTRGASFVRNKIQYCVEYSSSNHIHFLLVQTLSTHTDESRTLLSSSSGVYEKVTILAKLSLATF